MKLIPNLPSEAFYELFKAASERIASRSCNDYEITNTPEFYDMIEQYAMRNLNCKTKEEYLAHPDYNDYKVTVSKNGKVIYVMDWIILDCLENVLLEKGIIKSFKGDYQ